MQSIGWKDPVGSGKLAGTTGKALRVEALRISLDGNGAKLPSGSIEYRAHVQNIGWQDWTANGKIAGTTNRALRIEALMVRLTGELAEQYDVYYQTHVQNLGWMALASNGEASGSAGRSLRVEGVRVWLVKKGSAAPSASCDTNKPFSGLLGLSSEVHVQNLGWISGGKSSGVVGTTGKGLRLEAFRFSPSGLEANGSVQYRAHVQNIGWQGWKSDGQLAGTVGRGLRVEAVQLRLTDDLKDAYDIYYRVHVGNVGWLAWTKNGSPAGTNGLAMRIEAIQFSIVDKGAAAPSSQGDVSFAFLDDVSIAYSTDVIGSGWQGWKKSGVSGTVGKSKAIDGLRVKASSEDASGGVRYAIRPSGGSWSDWYADGSKAITSNEAVGSLKIELTGELSQVFDVWYRVHLNKVGWLGWAQNGQVAGNVSQSKALRIEAVQVRLVPKSQAGPGANRGYATFDRLSGDALVDEFVWTTIDQYGWSGSSGLESAYNYLVTTFPYKSGTIWYGDNAPAHLVSFAHEMVANHGGNCHRYAALLYWFGKALGCPLTVMTGKLGGLNGTNHGWLERKVNGVVYVVDPAVEVAYPEYDWYIIRYKDAKV
ncbi:MAG: Ig domain-containing protein, partial [Atopobiaceae bacterium]|nr:Ig domain-containing protein [Atopobiaceae bacterium]